MALAAGFEPAASPSGGVRSIQLSYASKSGFPERIRTFDLSLRRGSLYPAELQGNRNKIGAGNEVRTRNPQLGKLVLYQLSYSRFVVAIV
tara:strand:+ start:263 stop:532 length:270 start_codon:yes stop_codon:yes gene_type:complete